jgi:uncharacterized membrane protein (UPF0127 family)
MSSAPFKWLFTLVLWAISALVFFYLAWLGTTFARGLLPTSAIASAQTTTHAPNVSSPSIATTSANSPAATSTPSTDSPVSSSSFFNTGSTVSVDGNTLSVAVATTTAEIDQGLQNQPSLSPSQGELFVFDRASIYRFWMPNMNFPLDMIWIGSNKEVVDITKDAPVLPDPANPVWFTPKTPAQYVLEVQAGYADEHKIQDGDAVSFSIAPSL